jgi:hypothetical protein
MRPQATALACGLYSSPALLHTCDNELQAFRIRCHTANPLEGTSGVSICTFVLVKPLDTPALLRTRGRGQLPQSCNRAAARKRQANAAAASAHAAAATAATELQQSCCSCKHGRSSGVSATSGRNSCNRAATELQQSWSIRNLSTQQSGHLYIYKLAYPQPLLQQLQQSCNRAYPQPQHAAVGASIHISC